MLPKRHDGLFAIGVRGAQGCIVHSCHARSPMTDRATIRGPDPSTPKQSNSPRSGQSQTVQSAADQRMPAAAGKGQRDRDLAQRDTARRAAVLAGRASSQRRTSHRRFRPRSAPRPRHRDDRPPMLRRCPPGAARPDRAGQQVLQPVRPAMAHRLGDRPAVVIVQFHQQPAHHLAAALPGLPPGKAPGHPSQQVRQQRGPGVIGYRGSSDCRVLVVSYKPIMIAAAAPTRPPI
jgi:hypothetical protein